MVYYNVDKGGTMVVVGLLWNNVYYMTVSMARP